MHEKSDQTNQLKSGNAKIDAYYHTVEWLITAFAGTLVFIFFQMQVYRIPTGSMAETLRGAHFRLRCQQCAYRYDYDFRQDIYYQRYGVPPNATPNRTVEIAPRPPRCPSCGYHEPEVKVVQGKAYSQRGDGIVPARLYTVFKGDQIFVLKCIYQFFEPKRWDVMVFKNPVEPPINYIKRLVAGPGETLQIIDGNIFIDGQVARKPQAVQEELWMVVYDNDYQPVRPDERRFNGRPWRQPFENRPGGKWNLSADDPTVFSLDTDDQAVNRLWYNTNVGNDFRATYAYNDPASFEHMPVCSDLMVRCYASIAPDSAFGARLTKYGIAYEGWVYADGRMEIVRLGAGGTKELLAEGQTSPDKPMELFRFFNADQLLQLEYGTTQLTFCLGLNPDDVGTQRRVLPEVELAGVGSVRLRHIGVYRDIYYLDGLRATADEPLTLGDDEYFVCGDNSPFSLDSRLWQEEGVGNNGRTYPTGIVPREYLVGKAVFVHWPGGWRFRQEPVRWIPSPDGMKFIYGGQ